MRSWNRLVATTRSSTSFAPSLSLALRCCTGRPTTPTSSAATSTATTGSSSSTTSSSTSSESSFVSAAAVQPNSTTARRDGTTTSPSNSSSSREEVLAVWNNNNSAGSSSSNGSGSTTAAANGGKEPLRGGAGMNFASALGRKLMSPLTKREVTTQAGTSLSQVSWSQYERLDFLMNFRAPSSWRVHEVTRENYLVVQITPPPRVTPPPPSAAPSPSSSSTSAATKNAFLLHGLNISCFAYHRKVPPEAQSETLMRDFLKRFGHCVEDSVKIVDLASQQAATTTVAAAEGAPNVSKGSPSSSTLASKLASQLGGSVAEIEFTVKDPDSETRVRARALSRAFYATNRRFHYIVTMAVPEVEFAHSLDLVTHTVMGVTECRAEVAAKNF